MFARTCLPVALLGVLLGGSAREVAHAPLHARGLVARFDSGHVAFDFRATTVDLALTRFGRTESLRAVPAAVVQHEGPTVHLRHPNVDEWYRADARGIEQGFTLAERPEGDGEVVLELATKRARAHGDDLYLDAGSFDVAVQGLAVLDADGKSLPAHMQPDPTGFRIAFDDRDARYPVVVDPFYLVESPVTLTGSGGADVGCTYGPVRQNVGGSTLIVTVLCGNNRSAIYLLQWSKSTSRLTEVVRWEPPSPDNVAGSGFGTSIDAGDYDSGFIVGAPGRNAAYVLTPGTPGTINVLRRLSETGTVNYGYAVSYHNRSGAYNDIAVFSQAPQQVWMYHGDPFAAAGMITTGKSGKLIQPQFAVRGTRFVGLTGSTTAGASIESWAWNSTTKTWSAESTLGATSVANSPVVGHGDTFLVGPQAWFWNGTAWSLQATLATGSTTPTAWGLQGNTAVAVAGTTLWSFFRTGTTWSPGVSTISLGNIKSIAPADDRTVLETLNSPTGIRLGVLPDTKSNGAVCATAVECTSGFCADGVCCDKACTGSCEACTTAKKASGVDGVCGPAPAASTGRGGCPKGPHAICGPDGLCDGAGACRGPTAKGVSCGTSSCSAGTVTGQSCDGAGACSSAPSNCDPFVCKDAVGCYGSCTDDSACLAPNVCVAGACRPKLENGKPTTDAKVCASGFAADGVCCDSACTASCQACTAAKKGSGADGACGVIAAGTDPDTECRAYCRGATLIAATSCDGTGKCTEGAGTGCAPFGCETGACKTKCFDDSDCAGARCVAGACVGPDAGSGGATPVVSGGPFQACKDGSTCASGNCVDGVCCDSACTSPCHSCALPFSPGHCTFVPAGLDPHGDCGAGKSCHETCNGSGACMPLRAGDQCAPAKCTDATHGVGPATCPAVDSACPTESTPFDCGPYACVTAFGACASRCLTSSECAPGFACDTATARCVGLPAEDDGGCAIGAPGRSRAALAGVLIALLWLAGRARRSRNVR